MNDETTEDLLKSLSKVQTVIGLPLELALRVDELEERINSSENWEKYLRKGDFLVQIKDQGSEFSTEESKNNPKPRYVKILKIERYNKVVLSDVDSCGLWAHGDINVLHPSVIKKYFVRVPGEDLIV